MSVNAHDVGRSVDEVLRILKAFRTGSLCPAGWTPGEATLTSEDDWLEKVFPHRGPRLDSLAEEADTISLRAGQTIIEEGDAAERFYVIVSGDVGITRRWTDGRGRCSSPRSGAGQFFGEVGILAETRRTATVRLSGGRPVARARLEDVPVSARAVRCHESRFRGDPAERTAQVA